MANLIYIAGSSSERALIALLMAQVRALGYKVTYDWVALAPWDKECSNEELAEQAQIDLEAVKSADVIWYVAPESKSEGSATELGMALALGKHIIVSGALPRARIFPRLADKICKTHAEALLFLHDRLVLIRTRRS